MFDTDYFPNGIPEELKYFKVLSFWEIITSLKAFFLKYESMGQKLSSIPDSVFLENEDFITIEKNVYLERGAYIKGPCIIREGAEIRHGAYIRGNVIIGKRSIVGHGTEVKNSIFFENAKAAHFAYIGDSILGNDVNVGAGVICANFRFDGKNIKAEGEDTGTNKLGAILGDKVSVGCNAVLSPGTMIGPNSIIWPCTHISGRIESNSMVKASPKQEIIK